MSDTIVIRIYQIYGFLTWLAVLAKACCVYDIVKRRSTSRAKTDDLQFSRVKILQMRVEES